MKNILRKAADGPHYYPMYIGIKIAQINRVPPAWKIGQKKSKKHFTTEKHCRIL